MVAPVVTISAPFGTGGGVIGSAVAARLDVPFVDRAIPVSVAWSLAVPVDQALAHDERADTLFDRLLEAFAVSGTAWGQGTGVIPPNEHDYREETERVIRDAAAQAAGCVILGRAAAIVLQEHPTVLRVRLEGSFEARLQHVVERSEDAEADLRRFLEESDNNRRAYFRHFYRADPNDARLYHLVVDSTVLGTDKTTDLIVIAAGERAGRPDGLGD